MYSQSVARKYLVDTAPPSYSVTRSYGLEQFRAPWLILGMLATLVLIFAAEQRFQPRPVNASSLVSLPILVALGGVNRELIAATGEWYRLLTAPFLHLNWLHLIGNGLALLCIGPRLERLAGRAWIAMIYLGSGLGGAIATLSYQTANVTSVGASGAIAGLLAASFVIGFRLPRGSKDRRRMFGTGLCYLLLFFRPVGPHTLGMYVDNWAHLGGALTGCTLGLLALGLWPEHASLPRLRQLVGTIAVVAFIATLGCGEAVAIRYARHEGRLLSIPRNEGPLTKAEQIAAAPRLLARYPDDPRTHFFTALALLDQRNEILAEPELREAVKLTRPTFGQLSPVFIDNLRMIFVSVLLDNGHSSEARAQIQLLCTSPTLQQQTPAFKARLAHVYRCDK